MPESHCQAGEWSPERLIAWAAKIEPATEKLIRTALGARKYPQQAYRSCLGMLRLGRSYGEARLEAACKRALVLSSCRYKSIESILKHRLDQQPLEEQQKLALPDTHDNILGPVYYHCRNLTSVAKVHVLILDDWELMKLSAENRRDLLEVLEDRHGRLSTIATSQLPIKEWHGVIGDATLADVILDLIVHNAYKINLRSESMRKQQAKLTGTETSG